LQQNQLKYIEGSYLKLKKHNDSYLFYLLVKQHYHSGYIDQHRGLFTDLGNKVSMSKQTVSRQLKNNPFIEPIVRKEKTIGYLLLAYDKLWGALGYEAKSTSEVNPKGNGFKNDIKIAKIQSQSKKDLLTQIQEFEATRLLQRISYKSLDNEISQKDKTLRSRSGIEVQLSGERLSKALGYAGRVHGSKILANMKKKGVIETKAQKAKFIRSESLATWLKTRAMEKLKQHKYSTREFFVNVKGGLGKVLERQCNLITLSKDLFFYPNWQYNMNNKLTEQHKIYFNLDQSLTLR